MPPTKIGHRTIVIGRPAAAVEKSAYREPARQQVTFQRIVVVRNGELIGSRPGR
jgi:hypothetical protein